MLRTNRYRTTEVKEEPVAVTNNKELLKAIGYIRVSTEGQTGDDKYGMEAQRDAISKYATEHGYEIIDWKSDVGSGAEDDRPGMNDILYGDIYNPPIQAVIAFKSDRIARDTKLYFYYLYVLEKKQIKLISTRESFSEGDEFANIYRALMQFVAEQERKNIATRTGNGRKLKAAAGGYSGGRAPYGYRIEGGRYVLNPEEVEIVREIFSLRAKGMSMQKIASVLIDKGIKTRSGSYFTSSGVNSILKNEKTYRGWYHYGNESWVRGVHEAILEGDESSDV